MKHLSSQPKMPAFEEVEHTADRAFRASGRNLRELFSNAAHGLAELEGWDTTSAPSLAREVELSGYDRETLLVNWLNELLYLHEKHGESYSRFQLLELQESHLRARIYGQPAGTGSRKIKAVTFHGLRVVERNQGWEATIVVDV